MENYIFLLWKGIDGITVINIGFLLEMFMCTINT